MAQLIKHNSAAVVLYVVEFFGRWDHCDETGKMLMHLAGISNVKPNRVAFDMLGTQNMLDKADHDGYVVHLNHLHLKYKLIN